MIERLINYPKDTGQQVLALMIFVNVSGRLHIEVFSILFIQGIQANGKSLYIK